MRKQPASKMTTVGSMVTTDHQLLFQSPPLLPLLLPPLLRPILMWFLAFFLPHREQQQQLG